jgi:nicotinamidase-related amidase
MIADWGHTPAVIVVDFTRKRTDSALETSYEAAVKAADRTADLLVTARDADVPIFFTRGGKSYYTSSGADVDERGPWDKQNPIREETPEEAQMAFELGPQFDPHEDEKLITKRTPSAFFDTSLADRLEALKVDTVIVTGIVTSCCVRATVEDAFANNYWVVLPEECIADHRQAAHGFHMNEMDQKFADVASLRAVKDYVSSVA